MSSGDMRVGESFLIVILVFTFAVGALIGAVIVQVSQPGMEEPPTREESCAKVAAEVCPEPGVAYFDVYSPEQLETCRSREFSICLEASSTGRTEACREECSEIVKDLTRANEDLWDRWLACIEEYEDGGA